MCCVGVSIYSIYVSSRFAFVEKTKYGNSVFRCGTGLFRSCPVFRWNLRLVRRRNGIRTSVPCYSKMASDTWISLQLSHGDLDHAGGLQKVLEEHSVDILLVPDNSDDSGTMETVRTAMKNGCQIIAVTRHCSIELSQELQMKIYFKRDPESLNNSSLVIQLISTNGNVVFPGDLELSGENQLRREGFPDKCDLLTIAHHGSDSGTGAAFLEKLQPEYAIISVGRNNRYGHPSEKVLDRLSEAGIETYRTDLHGAVRVTFCSRSLVDTWIGQRERIVEIKPWQNEMK